MPADDDIEDWEKCFERERKHIFDCVGLGWRLGVAGKGVKLVECENAQRTPEALMRVKGSGLLEEMSVTMSSEREPLERKTYTVVGVFETESK